MAGGSPIKPLRILQIRNRGQGAAVALAGVAAAVRHCTLDEVTRLPGRVMTAMREVTFGELAVYEALMLIRAAASGRFRANPGLISPKPILAAMQAGGSGFLLLAGDGREIVMGMAGRPWASGPQPRLRTREDFSSFHAPASVRIVFNIRVEDEGGGWSKVTTERRVQATDKAAARTIARYWRVIYPGSGLIRRMWLNATRARAERAETGRFSAFPYVAPRGTLKRLQLALHLED